MKKITLIILQILVFGVVFNNSLNAQQNIWWKKSSKTVLTSFTVEDQYATFSIDNQLLENQLKILSGSNGSFVKNVMVAFPGDNGTSSEYLISRTEVLHPKLAAKYPTVQTYVGYCKNSPAQVVRFSYCPLTGLKGSITAPNKVTRVIMPLDRSSIGVYTSKSEKLSSDFNCLTEEITSSRQSKTGFQQRNANDGNLRRYDLALSVSGEYSQYFLDGTETDDTERKTKILAAMVSSINRVNGIFERDFNVTMQIIAESDALIYLDPFSDPYTAGGSLNGQLQNAIDSNPVIGSANYDVGHLFHLDSGVYGNAGCIACVCTDGSKGSAFTAHNLPDSDNFNMIVAHEFGHQFGGYHVQSSSNCRSGFNSEVEPGSGSTIMGYAGICSANVQNEPDDYFNYVDIRDVAIWTINGSDCAEIIPTDNNAPVVDAGSDYTIPGSTPFVLEGTATDEDLDNILTYCWEQNNPENPFSSSSPQSTWVEGPLFRSLPPSLSPKRYLPNLDDILAGNLSPTWEVLPSVNRTMRFELTVRDNVVDGGQSNSDDILLSVDASAGPFLVTSQSSPEVWNVGEEVTVTWDVANTNLSPVNAQNVDLLLSVDGGYTYPYVLQDDTANDGSETFLLPNVESSSSARIMVKASDNIFFAINESNFSIQASEFSIAAEISEDEVCKPNSSIYNINYVTYLDFEEEVTFSAINLPVGAQAVFSPASISGSYLDGTPLELTVTGIENLDLGEYQFQVRGNSGSGVQKTTELVLNVFDDSLTASTLISPSENEVGFDINLPFQWSADVNTEQYEIQIATDLDFTTIVESAEVVENSYIAQSLFTDNAYFWRIRNTNECGASEFSSANSFTTQCSSPENFRSTAVGYNYIELNWEDTNVTEWRIEYGLAGFEIGNGTVILVSSFPHQITGLNSLTSYDFYIQSTCAIGGEGIAVGPLSVATTEDFCNGDRFYDSGGPDGNYQNGENITTVISPSIPGERVRVTFNSFYVEPGYDYMRVYDGPNSTYPALHTGSGFTGGSIENSFISSDESGSLTFVFISDPIIPAQGWDASVVCEPQPNCDKPTDFAFDLVTSTTASLSWNTDTESSSWDIEYGAQGFQEGTGTVVNSTQTTFTISDLDPITSYDVYVRGNCTVGGVSDVIGPFAFQTLCDVISAPFLESFESNITPQCWTESGSEYWNYGTYANYDAASAGDRNVSRNTNYAWISGYFPSGENQVSTLSTPLIDTSTLTEPSVQFSVFSKNTIDNTYNTLEVELYDGADWNVVLQLQENTGGWRDVVIDLADYTIAGPIQVRFTITENSPGNSAYNDILIDEIIVDEMPSCPNPYNLSTTNIKGRSALVSWEVSGEEENWELQYGLQGFSPSDAITEFVTTRPYEITGLQPSSTYDIYMRSICDIGDSSEFIGPITFRTTCDTFEAPLVESFSSYSRPQCWEDENYSWSFGQYYDSNIGEYIDDRTPGSQSPRYMWKSYDYNNTGNPSYIFTPYINISDLSVPAIQFSLYSNPIANENYNTLTAEFFDGENWNTLLTFAEVTQGWRDFYFDLSSYTITDDIRIRFAVETNQNSSEFNYILIDDLKVNELPTCFTPNGLSLDKIGYDNATISWSAIGEETNWELQYGPQGFTPSTAINEIVSSNPYELMGLESQTTYDLYVRAVCGIGDSSEFIGPIRFTTDCAPIGAPYTQSFNYSYSAPPNCWRIEENERWRFSEYYDVTIGDYVRDRNPNRQSIYAYKEYNGSTEFSYLTSPLFDVASLTTPSIQFSLYSQEISDENYNTISVEFFDGENWNILLTFSESTQGWKDFYFDISSYTITDDIQIRFGVSDNINGSSYSSIIIDEVKVQELPICVNPYNLQVSDATADSINVSWVSQGDENSWELHYGPQGFIPGSGTTVQADSANITLNSLNAITSYDVYVRSDCGGGDYSEYVGPASFTTLCGVYETPFTQVFQNRYNLPQCWETQNDQSWNVGTYYDYNLREDILDRTPNGGTYYIWKNISYNGDDTTDYLLTPEIDISELQVPSIQFSLYSNEVSNGQYSVLTVDFYDGTGWNNLMSSSETTSGWRDVYFDLSSYTIEGPIQVRFGISDNFSSSSFNYILIDDIKVAELPSCFNPSALSVDNPTLDSATISWYNQVEEATWEVEYGIEGFTLGDGNRIDTVSNTQTLSDLESNTVYDVYVRTVCGSGEFSEWMGPVSFSTLADYCSGDHFYDSGGANGNYSNNENETTVIVPNIEGEKVQVVFNSFRLESCCDYLRIYDGPDNSAPLLGSFNGSNSPGEIVSTHQSGALTFVFTSDGSATYSGWDATVNCGVVYNCAAPTMINIDNVDSDRAALFWEASEDTNAWEIEYGVTGFNPGEGTLAIATQSPYYVFGLEPDTAYDIYIKTICEAGGYSEITGPISFRTEEVCAVPLNFVANEITASSASLQWDKGTINTQFYELEYGLSGFTRGEGISVQSYDEFYQLNNLEPTTSYDVYLRTYCVEGDTSDWLSLNFTTTAVLANTEEIFANELTITPNPNQGNFVLSYGGQRELKELILQDMTGKLVQKIDLSDFDGRKQISLFKPEAGVYFARIVTEKGTMINKRILIE